MEGDDVHRAQIRWYPDHLEDVAYVRAIFAAAGLAGVAGRLAAMLRSADRDEALAAMAFLRDAVNYGMAPAFARAWPRTAVVPALRAALRAPDFAVRRGAVYTIGKLSVRSSAWLLREAFPLSLRRDPLLLPGLLFELFWLTRARRRWTYLLRVAASPLYLVRWSLLDQGASPVADVLARTGPRGAGCGGCTAGWSRTRTRSSARRPGTGGPRS